MSLRAHYRAYLTASTIYDVSEVVNARQGAISIQIALSLSLPSTMLGTEKPRNDKFRIYYHPH